MNFLLHRHLAAAELASAEVGVGAMLPDLWRMADRRMRPRRDVATEALVHDLALHDLQRGIEHHMAADAWFHASLVFTDGERALSKELVAVRAPKLVMFAHAGWEMCLDGALLLARGIDAELGGLRHDVTSIEARFADLAGAHGAAALGDPARFEVNMRRLVDGLTDGAWIAGYQCGEGLADRVAGMRMRFGLPRLDTEQHAALSRILDDALARARGGLDDLLSLREAVA